MKKKTKWFKPKKHRGWSKNDNAETRRRKLLSSTSKSKTRHNRYLEAGRAIQSLANVTRDKETKMKAKADAGYFYKLAEETR